MSTEASPEAQPETQPNTQADQQSFSNELKGALFQNDKGDNPARPDYRGRCVINGREYRISGWKRKAKSNGKPFISFSFTDNGPVDSTTPAEDIPF